jgi:hypothetical protein
VKRAILAGFELFSDQKFKVKRASLTRLKTDTLPKQGYWAASDHKNVLLRLHINSAASLYKALGLVSKRTFAS